VSKRTAFWLAWVTWILYLAIATGTLVSYLRKDMYPAWPGDIFNSLVLLAFATVGSLIVSRRPQNPIGWIFCAGALLWVLGDALLQYAINAFNMPAGLLPTVALLGIIGNCARSTGWFLMITFLLLLFPDGHLPSPRWRVLAWLIAGLLAVDCIVLLLAPYPFVNVDPRMASVRNPLGIVALSGLIDLLANFIVLPLFAASIACIISVILRFRRSRGVERQQLKWFTYGMTLSILMLLVIVFLVFSNVNTGAAGTFFYLAVVFIPVSAGIAMLRYRLYDIDVLINRTLVYGLLTGILLGIYLALVFGGQYLLASFFGRNNAVMLVVSTLIVYALFQPLRKRIQSIIDRRFYRRKYNAARTLAAFSATLRSEVELNELREHLIGVVQETVQPAHVSLWLNNTGHRHIQNERL